MEIEAAHVLWSAPQTERAGRPLLIMLHGHRMNEQVGFELRHHLPPELVLAAVRGPRPAAGGGYAWFPLDATTTPEMVDQSASALLRWLEQVAPTEPVGILGFSQGVATAFQLVRRVPERFAYAVNLSGAVVPFPARGDATLVQRKLPVFWGRGDADPIIPKLLVESTRWWLRKHTDLTERVYPGLSHNVSPAELGDLNAFLRRQIGPPPG